jgi:hypothetical protein
MVSLKTLKKDLHLLKNIGSRRSFQFGDDSRNLALKCGQTIFERYRASMRAIERGFDNVDKIIKDVNEQKNKGINLNTYKQDQIIKIKLECNILKNVMEKIKEIENIVQNGKIDTLSLPNIASDCHNKHFTPEQKTQLFNKFNGNRMYNDQFFKDLRKKRSIELIQIRDNNNNINHYLKASLERLNNI